MSALTQRLGAIAVLGGAMGWGPYGGGIAIDRRHYFAARRAHNRKRNRIAGKSRARNRK